MRALKILLLVLAAAVLTGCVSIPRMLYDTPQTEPRAVTLRDGSVTRYMQFTPAAPARGRMPLIVLLHGSGEAGSDTLRRARQRPVALCRSTSRLSLHHPGATDGKGWRMAARPAGRMAEAGGKGPAGRSSPRLSHRPVARRPGNLGLRHALSAPVRCDRAGFGL
ncbi:MAG: hypothetical protein WDN06_20985 [Asticcacaulis sp.]